jgi:uroporphyrin-III C-methyltransferase
VTVWLVGAGPGDPGLITARGLDLVRNCDALVYDRLVSPELVAEAPDEALVVSRAGLPQAEINELLVELGRAGLEVVRLKGGDPFVYGRGGEEALALADAGIPFEVVPGVSALASVPAAAGIPLTHRGVASSVRVLSGRTETDGETIVVFMGLQAVADVCADLLAEGVDPDTPAAVVSRGTFDDQRVVVADVRTLPEAAAALRPPALVIVGDVVRLRSMLTTSRRSLRSRAAAR